MQVSQLKKMDYKMNLLLAVLLFIFLHIFAAAKAKKMSPCNFPVIYNFGDSNSDTGYNLTVDYSGKPTRPSCDGRLIVDFIAEHMGKPYLNSAMPIMGKLNPGATFEQGANFAVGGSTIRPIMNRAAGTDFGNEIREFTLFKAGSVQGSSKKDFTKALYTIDLGQNDVVLSMYGRNVEEIPDMIQQFAAGVKKLYDEGARSFWIHNTGPHGCLSGLYAYRAPYVSGDLDELGCLKKYNEVATEFNKQLKAKIVELRTELKEAAITHVDVHTPKLKLFSDAKTLGFEDPLGYCLKGNITCTDPSKYILWDGIHYTETANRLIALSILNGSLSDPPLPITHACYRYENM